ncbi:MAG: hypothetical protein KAQ90_11635 [Melioribacteraceae bacterium]|nr:hypothetical protein [Melioribacteraceae bacterium]
MRIALIQQRAIDDKNLNLNKGLEAVRKSADKGAQVICFAELAFEPFYPQYPAASNVIDLAETIPGPITDKFSSVARELGVVVILNLFEREGNQTFDCSPVIDIDGEIIGKTRMVHIPDYECFHEKSYYTPSELGAPVYKTQFGTIGVAICYDRHYPEYMRALALSGAEVVFVPQAGAADEWPEGLFEAEMQTTAFQNGYFTALCNRVGNEDKLDFAGESFVCSPEGKVISRAGKGTEEILLCDLDIDLVNNSHAKKLFLPDRRPELYKNWLK